MMTLAVTSARLQVWKALEPRNSVEAVAYYLDGVRYWRCRHRFRGFRALAASRKTELTINTMAMIVFP